MSKRRKTKYPEIEKMLDSLCYSRSLWDVWNDVMFIIAAALSNPLDCGERRDIREKTYMQTIKKYSQNEQETISIIFANIIIALEENPNQDLLGDMYMDLDLGVKEQGQFFTPYYICDFMAKITADSVNNKKAIEEKEYISMNEPTCGSGAMIIAYVNALKEEGINYQTDAFIVAQDISYTAVLMCYIQMSLLGCAGVVICGNSLTQPNIDIQTFLEVNTNAWFTPMYQSDLWKSRREAKLLTEMIRFSEHNPNKQKAASIESPEQIFKPEQLSLFDNI